MRLLLLALAAALPLSAAASEPSAALTREKADALLKGVEKKSQIEHHPGLELSKALGLPADPKNPYQTVYHGILAEKGAAKHSLARAKGVPGWLVAVMDGNGARYVRVDAEFKPVGAALYKKGDGESREMGEKETAAFLEAELALWAARPAAK